MSQGILLQDTMDFSSLWTTFDMLFLHKLESTELLIIIRILIKFFNDLNLFGVVLGIRLIIEVRVSCSAVPIWASFQLIGNVSVIVFLLLLFHIFSAVGRFAAKRKVADRMLICGLYILIVHPMSRELICVWSYLLARPSWLQKILGVRPVQSVSLPIFEPLSIGWA